MEKERKRKNFSNSMCQPSNRRNSQIKQSEIVAQFHFSPHNVQISRCHCKNDRCMQVSKKECFGESKEGMFLQVAFVKRGIVRETVKKV